MTPFPKALSRFVTASDGAITMEGVLWVPVYAFCLTFIVDTSLMFNGQAQAQRAIQDLNRLASYGYYRNEAEVEERGRTILGHLSSQVSVDATIDASTGTISTTATMPASDLMAVGLIAKFANIQITVGAQHLIES